jgi:hypothetical protein
MNIENPRKYARPFVRLIDTNSYIRRINGARDDEILNTDTVTPGQFGSQSQ